MRSRKSPDTVVRDTDNCRRMWGTRLQPRRNTPFKTWAKPVCVLCVLSIVLLLSACISVPPEGLGKPVPWSALSGWKQDNIAGVWPALLHSCTKVRRRSETWQQVCAEVDMLDDPDPATIRAFIEKQFTAHQLHTGTRARDGLITGYYEPLLRGSLTRSSVYQYPIYRRPPDLLTVKLGDIYPELANKVVRARVSGKQVVPYYSRSEIDNGKNPLRGHEIVWVDNAVDLFFLHIQGSGRIRLENGRELRIGYSDQNGHPYEAIGRQLIQMQQIEKEDVSLQSIKEWLISNPDQAEDVLYSNPSYIFFKANKADATKGPVGSLNVPLTPERSIAVDRRHIPLGHPVWLDTLLPGTNEPYQRLMVAQDTGGAINGAVRADIYFGHGARAENLAGTMKQAGRLFILLPNTQANTDIYASGKTTQSANDR